MGIIPTSFLYQSSNQATLASNLFCSKRDICVIMLIVYSLDNWHVIRKKSKSNMMIAVLKLKSVFPTVPSIISQYTLLCLHVTTAPFILVIVFHQLTVCMPRSLSAAPYVRHLHLGEMQLFIGRIKDPCQVPL